MHKYITFFSQGLFEDVEPLWVIAVVKRFQQHFSCFFLIISFCCRDISV